MNNNLLKKYLQIEELLCDRTGPISTSKLILLNYQSQEYSE